MRLPHKKPLNIELHCPQSVAFDSTISGEHLIKQLCSSNGIIWGDWMVAQFLTTTVLGTISHSREDFRPWFLVNLFRAYDISKLVTRGLIPIAQAGTRTHRLLRAPGIGLHPSLKLLPRTHDAIFCVFVCPYYPRAAAGGALHAVNAQWKITFILLLFRLGPISSYLDSKKNKKGAW